MVSANVNQRECTGEGGVGVSETVEDEKDSPPFFSIDKNWDLFTNADGVILHEEVLRQIWDFKASAASLLYTWEQEGL